MLVNKLIKILLSTLLVFSSIDYQWIVAEDGTGNEEWVEPTPTDNPIETETPIETEEPIETEVPIETEEPTETEVPIETETPIETEEVDPIFDIANYEFIFTSDLLNDSNPESQDIIKDIKVIKDFSEYTLEDEYYSYEPVVGFDISFYREAIHNIDENTVIPESNEEEGITVIVNEENGTYTIRQKVVFEEPVKVEVKSKLLDEIYKENVEKDDLSLLHIYDENLNKQESNADEVVDLGYAQVAYTLGENKVEQTLENGQKEEVVEDYSVTFESASFSPFLIAKKTEIAELEKTPENAEEVLLQNKELEVATKEVLSKGPIVGAPRASGQGFNHTQGLGQSSNAPAFTGVSGDGVTIEKLSIKWKVKNNEGLEDNLYGTYNMVPVEDNIPYYKFQIDYSLSGKGRINAGDIEIVIPAFIWKTKDGREAGLFNISTKGFEWKREGDNIVITNTKDFSASTSGFIQGAWFNTSPDEDAVPTIFTSTYAHEVVDIDVINPQNVPYGYGSDDLSATMTVKTPINGEILTAKSNTINATLNTDIRLTSTNKTAFDRVNRKWYFFDNAVSAGVPQELLEVLPAGTTPDDYYFVKWYVDAKATGSQEYTMTTTDTIQKIKNASTNAVVNSVNPIMLGASGTPEGTVKSTNRTSVNINFIDGYSSAAVSCYVYTAYKKSELEAMPGGEYVIGNSATTTVTGKDDGVVTRRTATGSLNIVDYNIKKVWNDNNNANGNRPSSLKVYFHTDQRRTPTYGIEHVISEANNWHAKRWDVEGKFLSVSEVEPTIEYRFVDVYESGNSRCNRYYWKRYEVDDEYGVYDSATRTWTFTNTYKEDYRYTGCVYRQYFHRPVVHELYKDPIDYNKAELKVTYDRAINDLMNGSEVIVPYQIRYSEFIGHYTKNDSDTIMETSVNDYGKVAVRVELEDDAVTSRNLDLSVDDYEIAYVDFNPIEVAIYTQDDDVYKTWYFDRLIGEIPEAYLQGRTANGNWITYAKMNTNGTITPMNGATVVTGTKRVQLPSGVKYIKQYLDTKRHYVRFETNVGLRILPTAKIKASATKLLQNDDWAIATLTNHATGRVIRNNETKDSIGKTAIAYLHGRNLRVAVDLDKRVYQGINDRTNFRFAYRNEITLWQQTNTVNDAELVGAINEGLIQYSHSGTFYDLLPPGMLADESSFTLSNGTINSVDIIENYKDSGRQLVIVKANIDEKPFRRYITNDDNKTIDPDYPHPTDYQTSFLGTQANLSFNMWYTYEEAMQRGTLNLWNSVAYEADESTFGSLANWKGEPDNPDGGNNRESKSAMPNASTKRLMTDLDPNRNDPVFVYASGLCPDRVWLNSGLFSIQKTAQLLGDNDNWRSGQDPNDPITNYEGGKYSYNITLSANDDNTVEDIVLIDALEDYKPYRITSDYTSSRVSWREGEIVSQYELDYERSLASTTIEAEFVNSWQGTLRSVDVSEIRTIASKDSVDGFCAPVVYYYFGDSFNPTTFGVNNQLTNPAVNRDTVWNNYLTNANGWYREDALGGHAISEATAIAIDCRKTDKNKTFVLDGADALMAYIHMQAISYEGNEDKFATTNYSNPVNNAYAYNTVYVNALATDEFGNAEPSYKFPDYTKVGIVGYDYPVIKIWDDLDDNDGLRPDSVTVELIQRDYLGRKTGNNRTGVITPDANGNWKYTFEHIPLYDDEGRRYMFEVNEIAVEGYTTTSRMLSSNSMEITNKHEPEKINVPFEKVWTSEEPEGWQVNIPNSIIVQLYMLETNEQTGEVKKIYTGKQQVVRKDPNSLTWRGVFTDVLKYNNGKEIVYTVDEAEVPEDFYKTVNDTDKVITNLYRPRGDLKISKTVADGTVLANNQDFTFALTLYDSDNEPYIGKASYSIRNKEDDSLVTSGEIGNGERFTLKHNQYIYISELPTRVFYEVQEEGVTGFSLTSFSNLSGRIKSQAVSEAIFTNTYVTKGSVQMSVTKELKGSELTKFQFRFGLYDTNGKMIRMATNKEPVGSIAEASFGEIQYSNKDDGQTFTYIIKEENMGIPGFKYDGTEYKAVVVPTDNGDGTMSVDVKYYDSNDQEISALDLKFNNTYEAEGETELKAYKELFGGQYRQLQANEFEFELLMLDDSNPNDKKLVPVNTVYKYKSADNKWVDNFGNDVAAVPNDATDASGKTYEEYVNNNEDATGVRFYKPTTITARNDAEGLITFPTMKFDELDAGKTYIYVIREIKGNDSELIYDETCKAYSVHVVDNKNGTLSFTQTPLDTEGMYIENSETINPNWQPTLGDSLVFENKLQPGDLIVSKFVTNPDNVELNPNQEFHFKLKLLGDQIKDKEFIIETDTSSRTEATIDRTKWFAGGSNTKVADKYANAQIFRQARPNDYTLEEVVNLGATRIDDETTDYKIYEWVDTDTNTWYVWSDAALVYFPENSSNLFSDTTAPLVLSGFNTSKVKNMSNMFSGAKGSALDLTGFDTTGVIDMQGMFQNTEASILDVSKLSTERVTNMANMFNGAKATTINLGFFETQAANNMSYMFANTLVNELDISSFDVTNVTNMQGMFDGCQFEKIKLGEKFSFDGFSRITDNNKKALLPNATWSKIDAPNQGVAMTSADLRDRYNRSVQGYSTTDNAGTWVKGGPVAVIDNNGNFKFYNGLNATQKREEAIANGWTYYDVSMNEYGNNAWDVPWHKNNRNGEVINSVEFVDVIAPNSIRYWFYECEAQTFDLTNLHTENVTNMQALFRGTVATTIDVSHFDTSKVTNMRALFRDTKVTSIDLSNFSTYAVRDMAVMFQDSVATSIDLSSFYTYGVNTMQDMFLNSGVTSITLGVDFSFKGYISNTANQALLPSGQWTNGNKTLWATGLRDQYPSDAAPVGTWTKVGSANTGSSESVMTNTNASTNDNTLVKLGLLTPIDAREGDVIASGVHQGKEWVCNPYPCQYVNTGNLDWKIVELANGDWELQLGKAGETQDIYPYIEYGASGAYTTQYAWKTYINNPKMKSVRFMGDVNLIGNHGYDAGWDLGIFYLETDAFFPLYTENIHNLEKLDTSQATAMPYFFSLPNLKMDTLDVSTVDISNLTSLASMFNGCAAPSITGIDSWDVSNVTKMDGMFKESKIKHLDLSSWNVDGSVTSAQQMFAGANALESLDISNFSGNFKNLFVQTKQQYNYSTYQYETVAVDGTAPYNLKSITLGSNINLLDTWIESILTMAKNGCSNSGTSYPGYYYGGGSGDSAQDCTYDPNRYTGLWIRQDGAYGPIEGFDLERTYYRHPEYAGTWIWQEYAPYTIQFVGGTDAIGSMASVLPLPDASYVLPQNSFYKKNYRFIGWRDSTNNISYMLTDPVNNPDQSLTIPGGTYPAGVTVTLEALWEPRNDYSMVDGEMSFYLLDGESIKIKDIPAGTAYQVWEETPAGWVLVSSQVFEGPDSTHMTLIGNGSSGIIKPNTLSEVQFTNQFNPDKAQVQFSGTKKLDNVAPEAGSFTFGLYEGDSTTPLQTVTVSEGGLIQFEPIEYIRQKPGDVGTHTYKIKEVVPNPADPNINYDTHTETVTVQVEVNTDGYLVISDVVYDSDGIAFNNTTTPGQLLIKKQSDDVTNANKDDLFTFKVTLNNKNGMPLSSGDTIAWDKVDENGNQISTASLGRRILSLFSGSDPNTEQAQIESINTTKEIGNGVYENIEWTLTSDGVLTLDTDTYNEALVQDLLSYEGYPWHKYSSEIKIIVFLDGETPEIKTNEEGKSILESLGFIMANAAVGDIYDEGNAQGTTAAGLDWKIVELADGSYQLQLGKEGVTQNADSTVGWSAYNPSRLIPNAYQSVKFLGPVRGVGSLAGLFKNAPATSIINLNYLDTSQVTNMAEMFRNSKFESIDVSSFDTSNVTDMSYMFNYASATQVTGLENFNTQNVTTMNYMFVNTRINSLAGLRNWNTQSLRDLQSMFSQAQSDIVDLGNWNVTGLRGSEYRYGGSCDGMFSGSKIGHLNLENWNLKDAPNWNNGGTNSNYGPLRMYNGSSIKKITLGANYRFSQGDYSEYGYGDGLVYGSQSQGYTGKLIKENGTLGPFATKQFMSNFNSNSNQYAGVWVWEASQPFTVRFAPGEGATGTMEEISLPSSGYHPIPANRFTRQGYRFAYWEDDIQGQRYWTDSTIGGYPAGSIVTLTAHWEAETVTNNQYKVMHYQQNESLSGYNLVKTDTFSADAGTSVTPAVETYTNFVSPTPQTVVVQGNNATIIRYYYDRKMGTITFDGNGAQSGSMTKQNIAMGAPLTLKKNAYKNGLFSSFASWNTKADGTGTTFLNEAVVLFNEDSFDANNNITLYAQWSGVDPGTVTPTDGVVYVYGKVGEIIRIKDLPAGTTFTVEEINLPTGWEIESITGGSGTIQSNTTSTVIAKNKYSATGKAIIEAHKKVVGDTLQAEQFLFELLDNENQVLQTAANEELDTFEEILGPNFENIQNPWYMTAPVSFELNYTQKDIGKTYTYKIRETSLNSDNTIIYDTHIETVTVLVEDDGSGAIKTTVTYDNDGALFVNEKKSGSLKLSKYIVNATNKAKEVEHEFTIQLKDSQGQLLTEDYPAIITRQDVDIQTDVDTSEEKIITYAHTANVTPKTKLNENFTNLSYQLVLNAEESDTFTVNRTVIPHTVSKNASGTPGISRAELLDEMNVQYGEVNSGYTESTPIVGEVTTVGVVRENTDGNVTTKETVNNIMMRVEYDLTGGDHLIILKPDGTSVTLGIADTSGVYEEAITGGNEVQFAIDYGISPRGSNMSGFFAMFTATQVTEKTTVTSTPTTREESTTLGSDRKVKLRGDEYIVISGLPDGATYQITEGSTTGWQLTSEEASRGTLQAAQEKHAKFTNTYGSVGQATVDVTKLFNGGDLTEKQFQFDIIGSQLELIDTITTDDTGHASYTFYYNQEDDGKTYEYRIEEVIPDPRDPNILYDEHTERISIKLEDNGQGALVATLTKDTDGVQFENTYNGNDLAIRKDISGLIDPETEFTFEITFYDPTGVDLTNDEAVAAFMQSIEDGTAPIYTGSIGVGDVNYLIYTKTNDVIRTQVGDLSHEVNKTVGHLDVTNGKGTFTLKGGEGILLQEFKDKVFYKVVEVGPKVDGTFMVHEAGLVDKLLDLTSITPIDVQFVDSINLTSGYTSRREIDYSQINDPIYIETVTAVGPQAESIKIVTQLPDVLIPAYTADIKNRLRVYIAGHDALADSAFIASYDPITNQVIVTIPYNSWEQYLERNNRKSGIIDFELVSSEHRALAHNVEVVLEAKFVDNPDLNPYSTRDRNGDLVAQIPVTSSYVLNLHDASNYETKYTQKRDSVESHIVVKGAEIKDSPVLYKFIYYNNRGASEASYSDKMPFVEFESGRKFTYIIQTEVPENATSFTVSDSIQSLPGVEFDTSGSRSVVIMLDENEELIEYEISPDKKSFRAWLTEDQLKRFVGTEVLIGIDAILTGTSNDDYASVQVEGGEYRLTNTAQYEAVIDGVRVVRKSNPTYICWGDEVGHEDLVRVSNYKYIDHPANLRIMKISGNMNTRLGGATFRLDPLVMESDLVDNQYLFVLDSNGNPVIDTTRPGRTFTTLSNGIRVIGIYEPGWYILREIAAPDGYTGSSETFYVYVDDIDNNGNKKPDGSTWIVTVRHDTNPSTTPKDAITLRNDLKVLTTRYYASSSDPDDAVRQGLWYLINNDTTTQLIVQKDARGFDSNEYFKFRVGLYDDNGNLITQADQLENFNNLVSSEDIKDSNGEILFNVEYPATYKRSGVYRYHHDGLNYYKSLINSDAWERVTDASEIEELTANYAGYQDLAEVDYFQADGYHYFEMRANQTYSVKGLPLNAKYKVEELISRRTYGTEGPASNEQNDKWFVTSMNAEGTIGNRAGEGNNLPYSLYPEEMNVSYVHYTNLKEVIYKVDTYRQNPSSGLSGAKFLLTGLESTNSNQFSRKNESKSIEVDDNGKYVFDEFDFRNDAWYLLEETRAPAGYDLEERPWFIQINKQDTSQNTLRSTYLTYIKDGTTYKYCLGEKDGQELSAEDRARTSDADALLDSQLGIYKTIGGFSYYRDGEHYYYYNDYRENPKNRDEIVSAEDVALISSEDQIIETVFARKPDLKFYYVYNRQEYTGQTLGEDEIVLEGTVYTLKEMSNYRTVKDNHGQSGYLIENKQPYSLPSSGGIGTYLFTLLGSMILAIAFIELGGKKRRRKRGVANG